MTAPRPTNLTHDRTTLPGVIQALLYEANDDRLWLALPYETLLRAAEQFEHEGSPEETGIMIDPTTGRPYIEARRSCRICAVPFDLDDITAEEQSTRDPSLCKECDRDETAYMDTKMGPR